MKVNVKKFLAMVLSAAMMLSMAACGGVPSQQTTEDESTAKTTQATRGMILAGAYVLDNEMANMVPFANPTTNMDYAVFNLIYEGLFYYNPKVGQLQSALGNVDSIQWNDDDTQLTIELNQDVKWQDGEDFTAEDVVFTYELLRDNATLDEYDLWSRLDSVTADGDDKVVFNCKNSFVALPNYLAYIFIVPEHQWAGQDMTTFTNNEPIGTGPFVFSKYTNGTSVEYTANADYWKGAPKVDGMTVVLYNSSANLTLALIAGEINIAIDNTIVMSSVSEFMAQEGAQMDVYVGLGNFMVMMNEENELLADPAVRQAMCMALNTDELIERGEYNCVVEAPISFLPEIFGDYVNEDAANSLTYDVEGAKKLLEDAGYTMGSDGIYVSTHGQRLSFEYYSASGAPAQQSEAAMIQQYLLEVGVEVVPRVATWAELATIASEGSYDLLQNKIEFPCDVYAALDNSFSTGGNTNYFNYSNSKVDALLESAAMETDETKLAEIYDEVQALIAADYIYIPMYNSGTHQPYYDGVNFSGWTTNNAPITSTDNLISIYPVQ